MKKSELYIILVTTLLFAFFFIVIPYWIYSEDGSRSVHQNDLIEIHGHIKSVRKTTSSAARHGKPVIYLELVEYPIIFRIAHNSYRAINITQTLQELRRGVGVKILTRPKELDRSYSNKWKDAILNSLLKWWNQPLVYSIRTDKNQLLSLDQYNRQKQAFNVENIKWGIILVLFIVGRLIWVIFQDRNSTRYNIRDSA